MPRYLTDETLPTIECCDIQYEWGEREDECLICGTVLDWEDCETHWNEDTLEDYRRFTNGEDDGDEDSANERRFVAKAKRKDLDEQNSYYKGDEYYNSLFKYPQMNMMFNDTPAKAPTFGRSQSTVGRVPKIDPFLDLDLPNETL